MMNERQYYLAERNHYFFGKLMSVRDFEKEQQYMNDRRRLGNRLLHGAGIVAGLNILQVDHQTISLESGMAIDYLGREIIVPEPCVKRLRAIEGFAEDGGVMYLGIRYQEQLREGTFSVAGSAAGEGLAQEHNLIKESYELFLTQHPEKQTAGELEELIRQTKILYEAEGIRISITLPKYAQPDSRVKGKILLEKQNVAAPVRFQFQLHSDMFQGISDEALIVQYEETEIKTFQYIEQIIEMHCTASVDTCGEFAMEGFRFTCGAEHKELERQNIADVLITTQDLTQVVTEEYYHLHFEDLVQADGREIYLSKFYVAVSASSYFIERMERNPCGQYLAGNRLLQVLQDAALQPQQVLHSQAVGTAVVQQEQQEQSARIVTGLEKINLGFSPKAGKNYYSAAFVHGLGYGKVAVCAALENKPSPMTKDDTLLLFGNTSIFRAEEFAHMLPRAEVGAMVNPEKGTLQLGVHLLEKTDLQVLHVRWWAFRPQGEQAEDSMDKTIVVQVEPNTVQIEPLAQVRFHAQVKGTNNQEVHWAVEEQNGGMIDHNGLYTAPSQEGVYQISAQSVKDTQGQAFAYAVVRGGETSQAEGD